jgi:hypothetical protein
MIDPTSIVVTGAADEAAARELADLMSRISERCCCAGWLTGNEFYVWNSMCVSGRPSHGELFGSEHAKLRELALRCDGWIVWRETDDAPTFVSLPEWLSMVNDRRTTSRPTGEPETR